MQHSISKDRWVEFFDLLSPFQQKIVFTFVDSLLGRKQQSTQREKRELLDLSVWTDDDIGEIEDAQRRINEWQIPAF